MSTFRGRSLSGAIVAIASVSAMLAACSGGSGSGDAAAGPPRPGGTLTFAVSSDAGCVDPQQIASNDSVYSARQLVDSLTDQDLNTGKIVPWLAQSWEVGPDATTFTFHLRPGATFSDGTPVNAQVVKDNFDAVGKLGPRAALGLSYLSGYKDTVVVDDLTARVEFTTPNSQFLQASSTFSLGLVAEASLRQSADQRCQSVIGSGPFVLDKYTPNQSVALSKRKGYNWGSAIWKHQGEAYLDRLVFQVVPESGVRVGSLQSGQIDATGSLAPQDEAAVKAAGLATEARPNPGYVFSFGVNNTRPLTSDPVVRQALLKAVDRQEVVDTIYTPETRPATSVLASTTPDYENLGAALAFDPNGAKKLLDDAGWKPGPDGVRVRNGVPLNLDVVWFANLATNQPTLELIQQQLKAVGIGTTLHEHSASDITTVQKSGDFDLAWGNTTRADPDVLRAQLSTKLANYDHVPPGPLESLLDRQLAEMDPAARAQLVDQVQQTVVQNAYVIPVVELTTVIGLSGKVHDLEFEASSRLQFHDTWLSS